MQNRNVLYHKSRARVLTSWESPPKGQERNWEKMRWNRWASRSGTENTSLRRACKRWLLSGGETEVAGWGDGLQSGVKRAEDLEPWHSVLALADLLCDLDRSLHLSESRFLTYNTRGMIPTPPGWPSAHIQKQLV